MGLAAGCGDEVMFESGSRSGLTSESDIAVGRKSNGGVVEPDTVLLRHNLRQGNGKNLRAAAT